MNSRTWIIFAGAAIAILAGLVFFSKQNNLDVSNVNRFAILTAGEGEATKQANTTTVASGISDQVYGNKDAKVVLIEYGDYSCPGCATLDGNLKKALEEYKDKVALVFRHFPITSIHPNSKLAAAYAEAAGLQGKFAEMHQKLFTTQREWVSATADTRNELFERYAKEAGLDVERAKKDITDQRVTQKINFDQALGRASQVNGTPTLFLNGTLLPADKFQSEATIKDALANAIKEAEKK